MVQTLLLVQVELCVVTVVLLCNGQNGQIPSCIHVCNSGRKVKENGAKREWRREGNTCNILYQMERIQNSLSIYVYM